MKEKTPREVHAEERREQIIEAATFVFSRKGFQAATNKEIAAEAGIAPGLIYHYFKDRQDLLANVVSKVNPAINLVRQRRAVQKDMPLRDALLEFSCEFVKFVENSDNIALAKVIIGELLRNGEAAEMFYKAVPQEVVLYISGLLEKHLPEHSKARKNLFQTALLFMGPMTLWFFMRVIFNADIQQFDAEHHVDLFMASLEMGD